MLVGTQTLSWQITFSVIISPDPSSELLLEEASATLNDAANAKNRKKAKHNA
tara:strand:- start:1123 stop:1278 length:156 start_codon:yes stop_codon:yes gene_type:complete